MSVNILQADGLKQIAGNGGGGAVTGVKGSKETEYREGDVNLTPENIGALPEDGKAASSAAADKLSTPRNISITGDVEGTISPKFDGSSDGTISVIRRGVYVGGSANDISKPWYRFASISVANANQDRAITFKVRSTYGDGSTELGILTAHIRTNNSGFQFGNLVWEYAVSGISVDKFVMLYTTAFPCNIELWIKVDAAYRLYHLEVMSEGDRVNRGNIWTLYDIYSSANGSASLPSGYTQIKSTLAVLKNNINGNATTATSATTATTATTATRATQDGNGNNIPNTYVQKNSDASLKSLATTGQVNANGGFKIGTLSVTDVVGNMQTVNGESLPSEHTITYEFPMAFYGSSWSKVVHSLVIYTYGSNSSFRPKNGYWTLGASKLPWGNIYSQTAVTVTSDRNLKKDINPLSMEFAEKIVEKLVPVSYRLIDGQSGRIHYGMISQQIEEVMQELGIDSLDFAPFIKSPVMEDIYGDATDEDGNVILDEDGNPKQIVVGQRETGEYTYMLRYEELYSILWRNAQDKNKRIRNLENIVQEKEEEIKSLKKRMETLEDFIKNI